MATLAMTNAAMCTRFRLPGVLPTMTRLFLFRCRNLNVGSIPIDRPITDSLD